MKPILVILSVLFATVAGAAEKEPSRRVREISVTLQADGEHCVVRDLKIPCTQLAAHLRDNLKLPYETTVLLRAGRSVSHKAVRKVLDIIDSSGFNHPGAAVKRP